MVEQYPLFSNDERMFIDRSFIDQVALPLGDRYENRLFTGYFADYAGMARKYRPSRIFEVGVRYGYIAMCLCLGAKEGWQLEEQQPTVFYRGIDDESYHGGSCYQANSNFRQAIPWADAVAVKWNSFEEAWPNFGAGYDFMHIDGNHDYHGVANDLRKAWHFLQPGGFILLDDSTEGCPIWQAVMDFLAPFQNSNEHLRWHYQENERNHLYIQRVAQ